MASSSASFATATVELPCMCGSTEVGRSVVYGHSRKGELIDIRPCTTCGTNRTYPPPVVAALKEGVYQSEAGFADQEHNLKRFRSYAWRLLDAAERHVRKRPRTLLDVGCGIGALLLEARERDWDVTGLELNDRAAEYARSYFGLNVISGSLEEHATALGRFDAITLSQVLEHVEKPHSAIAGLVKLLNPGGIVAIESPNMNGLYPRLLGTIWYGYGVSQHLWHFTPKTISNVAKFGGVRLVETRARACLDYPLPAFFSPLVDAPGRFLNAGDNMVAVFIQ